VTSLSLLLALVLAAAPPASPSSPGRLRLEGLDRLYFARVGGAEMKQGMATGLFWGVLAVALLLLTLYMQGDNNLEPASGAAATTQQ